MTWFSSGLSNLKEQINSIMNDADDNDDDRRDSQNYPVSTYNADGVPQTLKNRAERIEQQQDKNRNSQSPHNQPSRDYRRHVVAYSQTLKDFVNDVTFLSTSLNDVMNDIGKYIDENEHLRNEMRILKEKMTGVPRDATTTNNFAINNDDEKLIDDVTEKEFPGRSTLYSLGYCVGLSKETQTVETIAAIDIAAAAAEGYATNEEQEERQQQQKPGEVTEEQIENLIIEMDDITEKLIRMEEMWRKIADSGDTLSTTSIRTDALMEYTTLAHRRDVLWQKVKVSFVWPTVAKYKNAKISELSVPDSIKEVFQPSFVSHTTEMSRVEPSRQREQHQQQQQQLESNRVPSLIRGLDDTGTAAFWSSPAACDHPTIRQENDAVVIRTETTDDAEAESPDANVGETTVASETAAAVAEVDRLRKHLIYVEQAYTNELLQCEEEIQILRDELKIKEEKLKTITESYTCTNLSTNKTIEKLQQEMRQLADDKTQLTTQLRCCQNDLEKSLVDTHNLRSALDLFRKNKDSEISQATEKLKNHIRVLQNDNERLLESYNSLRNDVDLSRRVFEKNEFLSEELTRKQNEIYALKAQLDGLARQFPNKDGEHAMEITSPTTDTEAKVKLDLIKNIAFRYITSDKPTTKTQSLRILADVLEFSDHEKRKIGIGERTSENAANNKSLIDEFIRFVEKESHPRFVEAQRRQQQQARVAATTTTQGTDTIYPSNDWHPTSDEPVMTTRAMMKTGNTPSADLPTNSLLCSSSTSTSTILKDALNSNNV